MKHAVNYVIGGVFVEEVIFSDYEDFYFFRNEINQQLHAEYMIELGAW